MSDGDSAHPYDRNAAASGREVIWQDKNRKHYFVQPDDDPLFHVHPVCPFLSLFYFCLLSFTFCPPLSFYCCLSLCFPSVHQFIVPPYLSLSFICTSVNPSRYYSLMRVLSLLSIFHFTLVSPSLYYLKMTVLSLLSRSSFILPFCICCSFFHSFV